MNKNGIANIILIILVVALVGALGYVLLQKSTFSSQFLDNKVSTSSISTTTLGDDISVVETKTYTNNEIGIRFEYPTNWPDFKVTKRSGFEDPAYKGINISICSQPDCSLFINAFTADFTIVDLDEGGGTRYRGGIQQLSCSYYEIQTGCKTFEIQGRQAIAVYVPKSIAGGLHRLSRVVLIENPGKTFTGIVLEQPLFDFDVVSVNDPKTNAAYVADFKTKLGENMISSKDKGSLENLDKIVASFQFTK